MIQVILCYHDYGADEIGANDDDNDYDADEDDKYNDDAGDDDGGDIMLKIFNDANADDDYNDDSDYAGDVNGDDDDDAGYGFRCDGRLGHQQQREDQLGHCPQQFPDTQQLSGRHQSP